MDADELIQRDPREVLMNGEIGHVSCRLFRKNGNYSLGVIGYMCEKLTDYEQKMLLDLANFFEEKVSHLRLQPAPDSRNARRNHDDED